MFRTWMPLAHGALGPLDEIVVVVAFLIFIAMMIAPPLITWIKQQGGQPALTPPVSPTEPGTEPSAPPDLNAAPPGLPVPSAPASPPTSAKPRRRTSGDHYRLD